MFFNNGPRASLIVVHLTSVLFGKMDLSGLRHSSNIVCPAIIPNISVHSTRSDRAALVARVFHTLKCILKCSEHLISFKFLTNAVDIQGLIQCVYATLAGRSDFPISYSPAGVWYTAMASRAFFRMGKKNADAAHIPGEVITINDLAQLRP